MSGDPALTGGNPYYEDLLPRRSYAERERYACKVCGNVPDNDGTIEHGRGCYVVDENGGGITVVEFDSNDSSKP